MAGESRLRDKFGVRPSSGAATAEIKRAWMDDGAEMTALLAAREDRRTPTASASSLLHAFVTLPPQSRNMESAECRDRK